MPISTPLCQQVAELALNRCEYCLLHEDDARKKHELDNIIAKKHGRRDILENIAWSCFHCNRFKGTDFATIHWETGEIVRLDNPRQEAWQDHFELVDGEIVQLNRPNRVLIREKLIEAGRYP